MLKVSLEGFVRNFWIWHFSFHSSLELNCQLSSGMAHFDSLCFRFHHTVRLFKQVCIPVGCVPPTCWPYPVVSRGVCLGGVCLGGCLPHYMLGYTYLPLWTEFLTAHLWKHYLPATTVAGGNKQPTLPRPSSNTFQTITKENQSNFGKAHFMEFGATVLFLKYEKFSPSYQELCKNEEISMYETLPWPQNERSDEKTERDW